MKPILFALGSLTTVFALTLVTQSQPSVPTPAVDASPAQTPARAADSLTLFRNVRVFDGTTAALLPVCNVLVRGNAIAKISPDPIPVNRRGDTVIIDGDGKTLMPGLIDTHIHLFMGASSQAEMLHPTATFEGLEAKATEEARRMLLRGFTTARDAGGAVFGIKQAIDQRRVTGLRLYPSGAMISQTSGHGDFRMPKDRSRRFGGTMTAGELMGMGFIADGRDEVLTATRQNLRGGATQIKGHGGWRGGLSL